MTATMNLIRSSSAVVSSNHPKPKSPHPQGGVTPFNIASGVWWCKRGGMKPTFIALLALVVAVGCGKGKEIDSLKYFL